MSSLSPMLASALAVAVPLVLLWGLSVRIRDASIIDSFWGMGFVLVAWTTFLLTDGYGLRALLLVGLTSIWGIRLTAHIAIRNHGKGEDPRYTAMREAWGPRFWWVSLFTVFALQGVLIWIISLPQQVAIPSAQPSGLTSLDVLGAAVWAVGFYFEVVGDRQLARFKADPANAGRVLDTGLWRYTRHPNYFGDAMVWWGLFLPSASAPWGWATVGSPVIMTYLLRRVSGVPMLEKGMAERRPGYADYVRRTSPFFPRPPLGS